MTKEEAIEILNKERGYMKNHAGKAQVEAFTMAIKALEQKFCDDCISRQVVKEQMIKYGFHAPDMTVTEFVNDLPSVKPMRSKGHWVKVNPLQENDGGAFMCSECNTGDFTLTGNEAFCKFCGADMRDNEVES